MSERIGRWRPFVEARAFARGLGLLDQTEWQAFSRGDLWRRFGTRPRDIPGIPSRIYRYEGWIGMRDFLGPAPIVPTEPGYLPFKHARRYARSLALEDAGDWIRWRTGALPGKPKPPSNVPDDPAVVYPRAWRGWGDWLGTQRRDPKVRSRFLPFDEAREFARSLGLYDVLEWRAFCRGKRKDLGERPADVPANPETTYQSSGWNGYGDWLGTGRISGMEKPWLPFDELRSLVQSLHLADMDEYIAWIHGERPDLPPPPAGASTNPHRLYASAGWTSAGEFLGTGFVAASKREFRTFEEAREFARGLKLRSRLEWDSFHRGGRPDLPPCHDDVPACPDATYRDCGWTNWGDFLGTGNIGPGLREWRTFEAARRFARSLRLSSVDEWREFCAGRLQGQPTLPDDVPTNVEAQYADQGWQGWPDFLGHRGHVQRKIPFTDARVMARGLGLSSADEWREWTRRERDDLPDPPENVSLAPDQAYRGEGWQGWGDFLGTGHVAPGERVWLPFEEARAWARTLGLGSRTDWNAFRAREARTGTHPQLADIPAKPFVVYAGKGWAGWPDFLGRPPRLRGRGSREAESHGSPPTPDPGLVSPA